MGDRESPGSRWSERASGHPTGEGRSDRLPLRESLTAWRAAAIIAVFTVLITLGGDIVARLVDPEEVTDRQRRIEASLARSTRSEPSGGIA